MAHILIGIANGRNATDTLETVLGRGNSEQARRGRQERGVQDCNGEHESWQTRCAKVNKQAVSSDN